MEYNGILVTHDTDEGMDLDRLIGARLAVGFPGTEATHELIESLRRTQAQSLVLFSRNATSPEQVTRLLRDLATGIGRRFLVLVDHEGGRVIRFAQGVTRFPDASTVGRAKDPVAVERQGIVEATELRQLGVHVNLAPCVDVVVEGSDPIIGDRSYGSDPDVVSQLAIARIRGLQGHGVAACAKHFPGLGAVPRDPHKVLPTISLTWEEMERVHLVPFQRAIEAGVASIMSSHVCYPGLGEPAGLPTTWSPRLIRQLLRDRLRFDGVIMTDDLEMGALRAVGSMGEIAVRATEAGHDLLLMCSDLAVAEEALSGLQAAYQSERLSMDELAQSVKRIERLREHYLS